MKLLKVKTARFVEVVGVCGRPEPYTLWQKPAGDRQLQSFRKNKRVMTIQKTGTGTEFGVVGFQERKGAGYLIFPKSLRAFENQRVVGVNWDLIRSK